jgi:hypothetical protein
MNSLVYKVVNGNGITLMNSTECVDLEVRKNGLTESAVICRKDLVKVVLSKLKKTKHTHTHTHRAQNMIEQSNYLKVQVTKMKGGERENTQNN